MADNVLYADLNLPELTRSRILTVPDVQDSGCTYAEVKVKSQDTNAAANCKSSGKSCCSRKRVVVLAVIILVLVLAVCFIITYGPTAGTQNGSKILSPTPGEAPGCPTLWKKHERKCYFFSPEARKEDWNSSRAECIAKGSDLVIIESKEELHYLHSQSEGSYYLLGLRYSLEEQKWKWINNMEHDPNMFSVRYFNYEHCVVMGHSEVRTVPCDGSQTIQNLCEKAATMSERHQKES